VPAVAAPGKSRHNHGGAVDFSGDLRLAQQLGRKYGLVFPVKGEAWHAELGEGVQSEGGGGETGQFGVQYDLNYEGPDTQADPKEVIANRLHAVTRILGMDPSANEAGAGEFIDPEIIDPLAAATEVMSPTDPTALPEAGARQAPGMNVMGAIPPGQVREVDLDEDGQASYKPADPSQYGTYAKAQFSKYGFNEADYAALVHLWNKESGDPRERNKVTWNPLAQNPNSTAFGIAQFLNGTWAGTGIQKTANPYRQIDAGLMYIKSRYGSPQRALQFHLRNNWY
jgi:hypothetical protein